MLAQSPAYMYVKTKDMDRAFVFYTKVLGLDGMRGKGAMRDEWASGQPPNRKLCRGPHGARTGLIFIVKGLDGVVKRLKAKKVKFYIPLPMKRHGMTTHIADHPWGRHAWFRDSEGNEVMLFEARGTR